MTERPDAPTGGLGYQPALDGLRAVSVAAVVAYHAGFTWLHGGFLGVEVFFVISGFLITSLLIDERARSGRIELGMFWLRRARRLLPAVLVTLAAVSAYGLLAADAEQVAQLRRDLPWALLYGANWGQIVGDVPYFAPVDPPLLRHLWSLAVEEQWYLLWPLACLALCRAGRARRGVAVALAVLAAAAAAWMWWIARGTGPVGGPGPFADVDRINVAYLATPSRATGLLAGAALAFWRRPPAHASSPRRRSLDAVGVVAIGVLGAGFVVGRVTDLTTYPWTLVAVDLATVGLIVAALAPTAVRRVLAHPWLVAVGRRSYGLYLWHWPVFVVAGATDGRVVRTVASLVVAAVLTESSYRYVEMPVRQGAIGRAWTHRRSVAIGAAAPLFAATAVLAVGIALVEPFDAAVGAQEVEFTLAPAPDTPTPTPTSNASPTTAAAAVSTAPLPSEAAEATAPNPATTRPPAATTTTTLAVLPRSVAIVGDSQAHSIAVNLPAGIGDYVTVRDGSVDGCSVYTDGTVVSRLRGFRNDFARCADWADRWGRAAGEADVTLVVLGAWDVFDTEVPVAGSAPDMIRFGTRRFDERFRAGLNEGIDAIVGAGSHAALLEVACMRPTEARGQGTPPLPERGDDWRVAQLNRLLRSIAAERPGDVTFVEGPDEWCLDPAIATDTSYRWDGVHVYQRGANLILTTVVPALLAISVDA